MPYSVSGKQRDGVKTYSVETAQQALEQYEKFREAGAFPVRIEKDGVHIATYTELKRLIDEEAAS
jgi:hypothetical protein